MSVDEERTAGGEPMERLREQIAAESGEGARLIEDLENNPVCSVSFDASIRAVVVEWKRYATSAQLRYVHEAILQMLKRHGASKVLGNDTALPTIHAEDEAWIVRDWMPRAVSAGLRVAASKDSELYFGHLSIARVKAKAPENLVLRTFEDFGEARMWLKNQD